MSDQNPYPYDPYQPENREPARKKKNNQLLITLFAILGVMVILALAAFIYFLLFLAPANTPLVVIPTQKIDVQATAFEAAAQATAIELYLHPDKMQATVGSPQTMGQTGETPIPASEKGLLTDQAPGIDLMGYRISYQAGLLGLLGLVTFILLAFLILRKLRSSKN